MYVWSIDQSLRVAMACMSSLNFFKMLNQAPGLFLMFYHAQLKLTFQRTPVMLAECIFCFCGIDCFAYNPDKNFQ